MCKWCAKKQRTCSAVESSHLSICPAHLVTPWKALHNIVVRPQLTGGVRRCWCLGLFSCQQMKSHSDDTGWRCGLHHIFTTFLKQGVNKARDSVLDGASHFPRPSVSAAPHDLMLKSMTANNRRIFESSSVCFVRDFMNEPTFQVFYSSLALMMQLSECNQAQQAFMGLKLEGKSFPVLGVGGGTLRLGGLWTRKSNSNENSCDLILRPEEKAE